MDSNLNEGQAAYAAASREAVGRRSEGGPQDEVPVITPDEMQKARDAFEALPDAIRNHIRVVRGRGADETLVARSWKELQRFRDNPEVEELFQAKQRADEAEAFRQRILSLKKKKF